LRGLRNALEGSRKRWCDEENVIEAKRKQVTEETIAKVLKSEERRKAFEDRWSEIKARNLKALDEGTFEGPIVPIGFKPPEPPKPKALRDEAEPAKVTFLQVLDAPPEGVPKVVEGGSSGSGDPVPSEGVPKVVEGGSSGSGDQVPPEAPPPMMPPKAAPPPEADPPEAAPSKGEEVKHRVAEAPARLEKEAYLALEDEFIAVAKLEDLRSEDRKFYEGVRAVNVGVCSRCRWVSGCHSCDEVKAWGFACRSTLWNTAHEAVRPKAKPRGRPKKAAAKA